MQPNKKNARIRFFVNSVANRTKPMSLSLALTPSHILEVVSFKRSVGGACGAAYLNPAVELLAAPAGASGGTELV